MKEEFAGIEQDVGQDFTNFMIKLRTSDVMFNMTH